MNGNHNTVLLLPQKSMLSDTLTAENNDIKLRSRIGIATDRPY